MQRLTSEADLLPEASESLFCVRRMGAGPEGTQEQSLIVSEGSRQFQFKGHPLPLCKK